ncbi:MAG TPA: preprotein translocase subunit SecE [Acidimicrobiales bacterium]|nr:preprotein translocase subunit SecE [Acidimicrobiales bacterium]
MNRETKRMMQRQGQIEADGSPSTRRAATATQTKTKTQPGTKRGPSGRKRTTPVQFVREVRDEMRQVAWPSRSELINYTSVVFTTLIIMIALIFALNLGFGKLITLLFTK